MTEATETMTAAIRAKIVTREAVSKTAKERIVMTTARVSAETSAKATASLGIMSAMQTKSRTIAHALKTLRRETLKAIAETTKISALAASATPEAKARSLARNLVRSL